MTKLEKLMTIKKELGKVLFNFAEASAVDGTVLIYTDTLEVGVEVFVYDSNNEAIPAPDGKYDVEGMGTIVVAEGKISEIIPVEVIEEKVEETDMKVEVNPDYVSKDELNKVSEKLDKVVKIVEQLFSEVQEFSEKPVEDVKNPIQRKPIKEAMGQTNASKYFQK